MKFKVNDKVKMKIDDDIYCHGIITIIRKNEGFIKDLSNDKIICKVLFDEDWAPDYWYYSEDDLELDV